MALEQAIAELRALADVLSRQDDVSRQQMVLAVLNLADRMEGFEPLPRARRHTMTVKGRRVQVQRLRPAFGL